MPSNLALSEEWDIWPWAWLRSAGFPAKNLLTLAAPTATLSVDRLLDAEDTDAPDMGHRREDAASDWAADILGLARTIREWALHPTLREALRWQNRHALRSGVDALLRRPLEARDAGTRKHALLVARYLQRYCAKNDTIGFFGPVGWARVSDAESRLRVQPGPSLLARRCVYFEEWAIDVLARTLADDPALRADLAPRRLPGIRLEGEVVHFPVGRSAALSALHACALATCDGEASAREIARTLVALGSSGLSSEQDALALLGELEEAGLVSWTLEIPTGLAHPERLLRDRLLRVEGEALRERGLRALDRLEEGRRAVAEGSPERLEAALDEIEEIFTSVTGKSAARRPGETYAGRQLLYEDTVRDVEVEIGRPLLAELGPPLALVLQSARWYTHAIATGYRRILEDEYRALAAEAGSPVVDGVRFWERALRHFPGAEEPPPVVRDVLAELQARWAALLGVNGGAAPIQWRAADLRGPVEEAFAAPGPGWPGALHQSPDVMIAARDPAAIERGEYLLVLGELHVAMPLLVTDTGLRHCPDGDRVVARLAKDRPLPSVFPVVPRRLASRADFWSPLSYDVDLELGRTPSRRPREQVVQIGELVVCESDGQLMVRTRDGRLCREVLDFFAYYLTMESAMRFSLLPPVPHSPRVTVDRLVVHREQWRLDTAEMAFARSRDEFERFHGARRWARERGLPRFLFYRLPRERKPAYLDLESPPYVEIFAHGVRQSDRVTLSEMLPGLDEAWLVDSAGRSYTSELRLAVVDRRARAEGV